MGRIKEFDQQQILQQSWFDDIEAKMETLEEVSQMQSRRMSEIGWEELLSQKGLDALDESSSAMESKHSEIGLDDLILSEERLDQLDESSSATESHHNNTNNVEEMKAIVLQEMDDVNHELARCLIQTTECQGGLQDLEAGVDAESFQDQKQLRVHASLADNENLECQSHTKSVSETLNTKFLECQEVKTHTTSGCSTHRISGECEVCARWINLGRKFSASKGNTDIERCHDTAATSRK